jgi:hypothetical protein
MSDRSEYHNFRVYCLRHPKNQMLYDPATGYGCTAEGCGAVVTIYGPNASEVNNDGTAPLADLAVVLRRMANKAGDRLVAMTLIEWADHLPAVDAELARLKRKAGEVETAKERTRSAKERTRSPLEQFVRTWVPYFDFPFDAERMRHVMDDDNGAAQMTHAFNALPALLEAIDDLDGESFGDNSWAANAEALINAAPDGYRIRAREGGGPEDLKASLALTFHKMLEGLIR